MLNGGSMIWGFCVYFVYMIPLETDVLRNIVSKNTVAPLTLAMLNLTTSCFDNGVDQDQPAVFHSACKYML